MEAIVHLAAFFRGASPEEANAVNLDGTLALANAGLTAGTSRFIFASTTLVYGSGLDFLVDETTDTRTTSPYPLSKIKAEKALLELNRAENLGLCVLRLAFVYGDNDSHLADGMQWFRNWHPQRHFQLIHHADVAQAIMLALETSEIDGQIYNVADDDPVTTQELLQVNGEQPSETTLAYPINDPEDPFNIIVSTDKIRKQLGFRPLYPSLQDAIKQKTL